MMNNMNNIVNNIYKLAVANGDIDPNEVGLEEFRFEVEMELEHPSNSEELEPSKETSEEPNPEELVFEEWSGNSDGSVGVD